MAALVAVPAGAQTLPPFKDREFAYPPTITSEFGGDYRLFRYDKRQTLKPPRSGGGQRIGPQFATLRVRRTQRSARSPPACVLARRCTGR